jgi:hypothetical protein
MRGRKATGLVGQGSSQPGCLEALVDKTFWDGTEWVDGALERRKSPSRLGRWGATAVMVIGLGALIIPFTGAAARSTSYSPTLTVTFATGRTSSSDAPTPYVIAGCGYNANDVTVVVYSPEAASWTGRTPDANGCISVDNFSTQGAGQYRINAWQHLRNKDVIVASTTFTL